jgi:hypothetical protein
MDKDSQLIFEAYKETLNLYMTPTPLKTMDDLVTDFLELYCDLFDTRGVEFDIDKWIDAKIQSGISLDNAVKAANLGLKSSIEDGRGTEGAIVNKYANQITVELDVPEELEDEDDI